MSDKKYIPDQLINQFSKFISENLGLYYPAKCHIDLYNRFHQAAKKFGFSDPEACMNWLISTPLKQEQIETLSAYLTVGETYFYRDKLIYDSLEKHVLPAIINARRNRGKYLRIWSAGCSSGEEPYSIAILLHKMLADIKDWNISIIATDINQEALQKAEKGIYKKWSFRAAPQWMKEEYFIKNREDAFTIMSFIQDMISFSYHNLAKDPFPSLANNTTAIDIIFCRNVIMYFHPKLARRIINRFYRSLRNGGWLIVSGSEGYMLNSSRFVTVVLPDSIFYRKDFSKQGKTETVKTTRIDFTAELDTTLPVTCCLPEVATEIKEKTIPNIQSPTSQTSTGVSEKTKETDAVGAADELYNHGRYRDAENILTGYLVKDNENQEAISLLVKIYSDLGQFDAAIELCKRGIKADKSNNNFYYSLALIYQEQGKTDEAISSLHSSIYLDGGHVLSYYTLGNILFRKGDIKKANKYLNNALSLLNRLEKEIILPGSDGLSAGRLTEIIKMKNLPGKRSNHT